LHLEGAANRGRLPGKEGGRLIDTLALSQTSPSQVVSKREQFDALADALAGLPGQEADVLWLCFAESLTFEMIGERLNLSRKSVSRIVGQSLKKLRRSLDGPPGGALKYDERPAN
jgi:RNA polymerase sigma factor (sigma-70 family)